MKSKRSEAASFEQEEEDPVHVRVMYVCEDCDYRWQQDVEPKRKESYNDPEDLDVHEFRQSCPICGSHSIDLDEG